MPLPVAYRRHLLARILEIAGTGSAGLTLVAVASCGARSPLGISGSVGSGGETGAGGVGGAGTSFSTSSGLGLGGAGGSSTGFVLASSSSSTAVSVGSGSVDGGAFAGTACIPPDADAGGCLDAGDAAQAIQGDFFCDKILSVSSMGVENGLCCYEVVVQPFPCYVGRTFFVDEGIVKAELRAGRAWRAGRSPAVAALPEATRRALGEAWARDGLFEHASVASFSRFAMQLLALGAPADLVRDTHAAAMDEVRHAELCLGLASAYLGRAVEPTALPIDAPLAIVPDLAAVAAEVVMEGCIGETVATLQALDALAAASDPAVREALEVTVADETRHAELAWRFVAWAIDEGGDPVREAVQTSFAGFRPPAPRLEALDDVDLALYAEHGRQRAAEGRAIAERAMAEILQPAMCKLLSRRPRLPEEALS